MRTNILWSILEWVLDVFCFILKTAFFIVLGVAGGLIGVKIAHMLYPIFF